jgi:hypothetical protein
MIGVTAVFEVLSGVLRKHKYLIESGRERIASNEKEER